MARRNRLTKPTATLHWYNAPTDISEQKLIQVYQSYECPSCTNTFYSGFPPPTRQCHPVLQCFNREVIVPRVDVRNSPRQSMRPMHWRWLITGQWRAPVREKHFNSARNAFHCSQQSSVRDQIGVCCRQHSLTLISSAYD